MFPANEHILEEVDDEGNATVAGGTAVEADATVAGNATTTGDATITGDAAEDGNVDDANVYKCMHCERYLPSKKGLHNHKSRYHLAAVSAMLVQQASTLETCAISTETTLSQGRQKKTWQSWTGAVQKFKKAVQKVG